LQLILADDDPVFRLGVRLWLDRFPDLQVVLETADRGLVLQHLAEAVETGESFAANPLLVLLSISLGQAQTGQAEGLTLGQQIKTDYPQVPVLLLGDRLEPVILTAAQQVGANGYCLRRWPVEELESAIRRVAAGQPSWPNSVRPGYASPEPAIESPRSSRAGKDPEPSQAPPQFPGAIAILKRNLRYSGLRQINANIDELTRQLNDLELSLLDRAIVAGRRRELLAARWVVNHLLATPELPDSETSGDTPSATTDQTETEASRTSPSTTFPAPIIPAPDYGLEATPDVTPITAVPLMNVQSVLLDRVLAHLQGNLINQTEKPLEIDILREEKKRELFYLVLRKFEDILGELRYSQVQPEQLPEQRLAILTDLWQATLTDFFGKYATLAVSGMQINLVETLLQEQATVQTAMLNPIPGVIELLAHLLFQMPLEIDSRSYPPGNPEALARAELLLDHLLIQLANGVIYPLLNLLGDVEPIKQNFYDRRLMSSREIARFRNNLSWRYRIEKYVGEPTAIFESQYRLFIFHGRGIKTAAIYAPRKSELEQLSGLQLAVTLTLEARDAIAPRVRSALSVVGSGVIYVLTEVVGRGIGLVGRGILKGLGNAWQEGRSGRSGNR
jgi:DNA-binding NarL/FixJ family response regulator